MPATAAAELQISPEAQWWYPSPARTFAVLPKCAGGRKSGNQDKPGPTRPGLRSEKNGGTPVKSGTERKRSEGPSAKQPAPRPQPSSSARPSSTRSSTKPSPSAQSTSSTQPTSWTQPLSTQASPSTKALSTTSDSDAAGDYNEEEESLEVGLNVPDNYFLLPFSLLQKEDGGLPIHDWEEESSVSATSDSVTSDPTSDGGDSKRAPNPSKWKTTLAKLAVQTGAEHFSAAGNLIKKKEIQPACKPNCRYQCHRKVQESDRVEIFSHFWSITNQTDKWDFINRHVTVSDKKSNTANVTRRKTSRQYFFTVNNKLVKVCKTMFLSTLDICDGMVETVARKIMTEGCITPDKRGTNHKRIGIHLQVRNSVAEHINAFPRVPIYDVTTGTSKEYLEEGLTVRKMHELYIDWMKENYPQEKQATERQYRDVFNSEFDLGFITPMKEKCELCHQWESAAIEDKDRIKEEYCSHVSILARQRELFKVDTDTATKSKTSFCLASFYFQKIFYVPKAQASAFYYKSKLAVYNFTVYDLIRHEGSCYVYDESIGQRGSNEVASFLFHFISEQVKLGMTTFRFYTSNCPSVNKNLCVFSMLVYAAAKFKVDIAVRYLQEGHSQTEGDSVQTRLEKATRTIDVFSPPDWYHQIREAKKSNPYNAIEVTQEGIFDFIDLADKLNFTDYSTGYPYPVLESRDVFVDGVDPGFFKFRVNFEEEYRTVPTVKPSDPIDFDTCTLKRAYASTFGVDPTRLEDLLFLCDGNYIPQEHQAFYRNLVAGPETD